KHRSHGMLRACLIEKIPVSHIRLFDLVDEIINMFDTSRVTFSKFPAVYIDTFNCHGQLGDKLQGFFRSKQIPERMEYTSQYPCCFVLIFFIPELSGDFSQE